MTTAAAGARRRADRLAVVAAVGPAGLYVLVLLAVPFALLLWISVDGGGAGGPTLRHYAQIFQSRLYLDSLLGTVQLVPDVINITVVVPFAFTIMPLVVVAIFVELT